MLKNIETIGFLSHFIIGRISIEGGPGSIPPLTAPMSRGAGPEYLHQGVVKSILLQQLTVKLRIEFMVR